MRNLGRSKCRTIDDAIAVFSDAASRFAPIVVKGLDVDAEALRSISEALGDPVREKRNFLDGIVFAVEEHREKTPFPAYANTPFEFECHTDGSGFPRPPDIVFLWCETQSESGGESLLAHCDLVVAHLAGEDRDQLLKREWQFAHDATYPILEPNNQDRFGSAPKGARKYQIRLSQLGIELNAEMLGCPLSDGDVELLRRLDLAVKEVTIEFLLEPGDLLMTPNRHWLHGRKAFQSGQSPRRLLRSRVWLR